MIRLWLATVRSCSSSSCQNLLWLLNQASCLKQQTHCQGLGADLQTLRAAHNGLFQGAIEPIDNVQKSMPQHQKRTLQIKAGEKRVPTNKVFKLTQ